MLPAGLQPPVVHFQGDLFYEPQRAKPSLDTNPGVGLGQAAKDALERQAILDIIREAFG